MGCIYRRNKIYWVKYYRKGISFCESSHSEIKAEAERLLKLREGEISQGKPPGICFDRVLFDELAEDYLTDYRVNLRKTSYRAGRSVEYLSKEFGRMKATEITTSHVKRFIDKRMQEGAANATINRELAALKRMFNLGAECTPPKVSQVPHIPMLREDNVRKGFFEPGSFDLLMEYLPEHLRPVVFFGYCTGWRKGEILSLTWKQVDLVQGIVRLEPGETKNSEGRTIYMESDLWDEMKKLLGVRKIGCPFVFHTFGKKIGDFRKSWTAACKSAGIPGMLFHDLRRTAIRNMIRAGIPERVAMAISGHKTRAVFDRYNIVSLEDLRVAAQKRQEYRNLQSEQLRFGYGVPKNEARVVTLKATTP